MCTDKRGGGCRRLLRRVGISPERFCAATANQEIDSSAVVLDKADPLAWRGSSARSSARLLLQYFPYFRHFHCGGGGACSALHLVEAMNRRWPAAVFEVHNALPCPSAPLAYTRTGTAPALECDFSLHHTVQPLHRLALQNDNYLSGDKDSWLIAALLASGGNRRCPRRAGQIRNHSRAAHLCGI